MAAVALALVSSVAYASAAVVQERLAATTAPSRYGLLTERRWWLSVALNGTGALLHAGALGLGSLIVVQPLGVLVLVLAPPLAAALYRQPVSGRAWRGIATVAVGLTGLLLLTGASPSSRPLSGTQQLLLATGVVLGLTALVLTGAAGRRGRPLRTTALATAAGVAYGAASVFVKSLSDSRAATDFSPMAALPVAVLVVVLAATGLAASQAAYRGGLAAPLAVTTVVNPAFAAAAGVALLGEGFRFGALGALGAAAATVVTVHGLAVLAKDGAARVADHEGRRGHPPRQRSTGEGTGPGAPEDCPATRAQPRPRTKCPPS